MKKNKQKRANKKAKNKVKSKFPSKLKKQSIQTSFTGGNLTNYSGIKVLYKFMRKLGVNEAINSLGIAVGHNAKYSTDLILTTLILGIQAGMNRLSKIEKFSYDPLLLKLIGLSAKISDSTIINRLKRFTMRNTN
ncbi:MAG: transposase, partial [Candidatus Kapabacteria bacterium]|nr:transposase [Candidatus Kapabacteria bacterium]